MPMEPVWLQCGCCDTARRYGRCGSEIARDLESAASGLDWLTCLNCANTRGPRTLAGTATTRRASVASGGGTDAFRPVPRESHGGTGGRMNRGRESQGRSLSNTLVPARWGAYELQINNEDQKWATGSIENFIQRLVPVNPAPNEWHSYDVEVRGITWFAKLGGTTALDGRDSKFRTGHIALNTTRTARSSSAMSVSSR